MVPRNHARTREEEQRNKNIIGIALLVEDIHRTTAPASQSIHIEAMSNSSSPSSIPLVAGLLGGGASTVLLYPLDLVKVRLQVNESSSGSGVLLRNRTNRTIANTLQSVVKHEGVIGLYQGLTPALIGSAASWGGYFFFYEGLKTKMIERKKRMENTNSDQVVLGSMETFTAACVSGAIMVGCTNPIWLIKTRMQLQMKRTQAEQIVKLSSLEQIKPPYKNILDAVVTIVREEGVTALYKGGIPALMLVSHGGVQFVTYEFLKSHFGAFTKAARSDQAHERGVFERLQDSAGYLTMGAVSKM